MTTDRDLLVSQVDIPEDGDGPTDGKVVPVSNKPGVFAQSLSPLVQFMQDSPRRVENPQSRLPVKELSQKVHPFTRISFSLY